VPDEFLDPITMTLMHEPVVLPDSQVGGAGRDGAHASPARNLASRRSCCRCPRPCQHQALPPPPLRR
jgi:hypothetical protein